MEGIQQTHLTLISLPLREWYSHTRLRTLHVHHPGHTRSTPTPTPTQTHTHTHTPLGRLMSLLTTTPLCLLFSPDAPVKEPKKKKLRVERPSSDESEVSPHPRAPHAHISILIPSPECPPSPPLPSSLHSHLRLMCMSYTHTYREGGTRGSRASSATKASDTRVI